MKKTFIAAMVAVFSATLPAQNWQYLSVSGMSGNETATAVSVEPSGSVTYAGGTFTDSIMLGSVSYGSTGLMDGYIAKYSSNGTVQWSEHISVTNSVCVSDIAYAANWVYATGTFSGVLSMGNTSVLSNGGTDMFMCRLAAGTGAISWLVSFGGSGNDSAYAIAVGVNTLCVGGSFRDSFLFGSDMLVSSGGSDACMLVSDLAGVLQWARSGGGAGDDHVASLVTSVSGDWYAFGSYTGTASFGQVALTSSGEQDLFVQKYGVQGVWGWIRPIYGVGQECATDMTIDQLGRVYLVGTTTSAALFFMSQSIATADSVTGFLASYDENGYATWVRQYPSFVCRSVVCTNAHVFVAGVFSDSCSFGQSQYISLGKTDGCIVKSGLNGTFIAAHQCGGLGNESVSSLSVDQNGACYLAGSFSGMQTCFSPYTVSNADPSGLTSDAYLGKFPGWLLSVEETIAEEFVITLNPFTEYLMVTLPVTASQITLTDIAGRELIRTSGTGLVRLERGNIPCGMYILSVSDEEGYLIGTQKVLAE